MNRLLTFVRYLASLGIRIICIWCQGYGQDLDLGHIMVVVTPFFYKLQKVPTYAEKDNTRISIYCIKIYSYHFFPEKKRILYKTYLTRIDNEKLTAFSGMIKSVDVQWRVRRCQASLTTWPRPLCPFPCETDVLRLCIN